MLQGTLYINLRVTCIVHVVQRELNLVNGYQKLE